METLDKIRRQIRFYPDFPKKGVNFIDVLPLLGDSATFGALTREIAGHITTPNVAVPEARGFLFGAPLLLVSGGPRNLIAFRKSAKLPADGNDLVKVSIVKEYGEDSIFFRRSDLANAVRTGGVIEISIFDDILATGGTAEGMAQSLNAQKIETPQGELSVSVKEFVFLAEIAELQGRERLEKIAPVTSLISF
jgi:adenine phosphoribosyltransferase